MKRQFRIVVILVILTCMVFPYTFGAGQKEGKAETIIWKMHDVPGEDSALVKAHQALISDEIYERTNGGLEIIIYPNSVLGGERDVMQSLQAGSIEMMSHTMAITGNYVSDFNFLTLPFLFDDREHFERFTKTEEAQELFDKTKESGFYFMGAGLIGFRTPTLRDGYVKKPSDFEGKKMRTMENKTQIETMEALGATPTPLPFPDIYNSIKLKTVDGQFNDALAFEEISVWEVAPYHTNLPLWASAECLSVSKKALDSLPQEYQEVVWEVCKEASPEVAGIVYEEQKKLLNKFIEENFEGNYNVEDLDPFREKVKPLYEELISENPEVEKYIEAVNRVR